MANNKSKKILLVVARFNEMVTRCLLEGALEVLKANSYTDKDFEVLWVPGCFEIPVVCAKAVDSGNYGAVITLGAVIRGETPHFDFVAGESARAIMDLSVRSKTPIIFGILTTNTVEQALNRSGIKYGNKGRDAAAAAVEMLATMARI